MRKITNNTFYEIEALHHYNIDVRNRELFLVGEHDLGTDDGDEPGVEFVMSSRFIRNLRYLVTLDSNAPILIHMKTNGGIVPEGMAIFDAIKLCPCPVYILNYTHARSMSSMILQAADWRVMMPNSYFMFHRGSYNTDGEYLQVCSEFDFYRKTDKMIDIYADAIIQKAPPKWKGKTREQIKAIMNKEMDKKVDVFLTAQETVEWGLADAIFEGDWDQLKQAM